MLAFRQPRDLACVNILLLNLLNLLNILNILLNIGISKWELCALE